MGQPRKGPGETLARFMTPLTAGDSEGLHQALLGQLQGCTKGDWHGAGKGWGWAGNELGWGRGCAQNTAPWAAPWAPCLLWTSGLWNPARPRSPRGLSTAPKRACVRAHLQVSCMSVYDAAGGHGR